MRRRINLALLALTLAACAPGYDDILGPTTSQPPRVESAVAELAVARAKWASFGPDDYTYMFTNDCGECGPAERSPRRVAVLKGEPLAVEGERLLTVEDVFASIKEALEAGRDVRVIYDQETGLPRDVQIDMDMRPVDGGTHWILSDPTGLPPVDSADELQEARRLWEAQGLDDYQFLMRVECDCPEHGTFDVKVIDDRIVEVVQLDRSGETGNVTPVTISQTFDDLEEWFNDGQNLIDEGILAVDVRVDPVMGYPRWVYVKAESDDAGALFTAVVTLDLAKPLDPNDFSVVPDPDDLTALELARRLWVTTGPSDYRYTLTIHCLCPEEYSGPFEIAVRNQQVVSATWKGNPLGPDQGAAFTVEEVFALVERGIFDLKDVDATYDPVLGHPLSVIIDVEAVAVDGGLAFSIDDFTPLRELGGIAGQVLSGPTCPVERDPPDPACADRPVTGAVLVVFNGRGEEVARIVSNPNGNFKIELDPGTYRVEPQPVYGLLGTPAPFELEVGPGLTDQVTVSYDTGIR